MSGDDNIRQSRQSESSKPRNCPMVEHHEPHAHPVGRVKVAFCLRRVLIVEHWPCLGPRRLGSPLWFLTPPHPRCLFAIRNKLDLFPEIILKAKLEGKNYVKREKETIPAECNCTPYNNRIESGEELGGFVRDGHDISAWNVPFLHFAFFFHSKLISIK